jgi:prepilin peptidase CpaA
MEAWKVKVRTKVTLPLLLLGLVYHALKEGGPGFAQSLLAALVGFGLLMALHLLHGITAGDVGLMTAVSAWLGMPLAVYVLGISSLTAGSYAAVRALVRGEAGTLRIKMQLAWHRARAIGRYMVAEERVEGGGRTRRREAPFAMMVAFGIITFFAVYLVRGSP